jgi:DnaJ-class molecular chaperone
MKPLFDQDHYEILEVSRDASREEIERSFRMAEAIYADDSLAGYSVFGEGDARAIRERIEIAYRVLSDVEARSAYDAALARGTPRAVRSGDLPREIEGSRRPCRSTSSRRWETNPVNSMAPACGACAFTAAWSSRTSPGSRRSARPISASSRKIDTQHCRLPSTFAAS